MPLVTQQNLIEMSDFSGGWAPGDLYGSAEGLIDTQDPTVLPDVENLIIDPATGSLQSRPGFEAYITNVSPGGDYWLREMAMHGGPVTGYIILVYTDGSSDPNNVKVYAYDLDTDTGSRIDDAGVTWSRPLEHFWFAHVDGVLYGGSRGNAMWSWTPGTGWDAEAGIGTYKDWTSDSGASVNTATEFGKDYAWTGKEKVSHSGDIFMPNVDIRYDTWDVDFTYGVGDRVSRKTNSYFKSYRCIKQHAADSDKAPDSGADWRDYWKRVTLPRPTDEDGDTSAKWTFMPTPAETSIAAWFADRLFLRFDGQGDNSRLQYSAPIKLEKGEDIADTEWNPKDWAPGNDIRGQGGGWIPFNDGAHQAPITALRPFEQYLLVFKRNSTWVLSGTDDTTWNVRRIARGKGAIYKKCVVEQDGLVYFLDDQGLCVTDGTAAKFVPGNEKLERWFKERIGRIVATMNEDGRYPTLFKHKGLIGITLPDFTEEGEASHQGVDCTVFYDPVTESFWPTTLPILWIARRETEGFAHLKHFATTALDDKDSYTFDPIGDDGTDDGEPVWWWAHTAWLPFGTLREQRRIRRVAALVKGAGDYCLQQFKDWDTGTVVGNQAGANRTITGDEAQWVEGYTQPDAHAIQLYIDNEGNEGPSYLLGFAIDTEPRRKRYHS